MDYKTNHPQINEVLDLYNKESHPFIKVHRMIDLFEIIIKSHTAYNIADYFQIKNLSDKEIQFLWNLNPVLRQLANELTVNEDYDQLLTFIRNQQHSISILVMLDQVTIKNEVYSEITKTHVYLQLLKRCY